MLCVFLLPHLPPIVSPLPKPPITTTSDPSTPAINGSSSNPPSLEKIVFVTSDAERYVTVDISGAKTAPQIRELILTKVRLRLVDIQIHAHLLTQLNIFTEDECRPYSIYRTEIGSFAIGEALSNERLLALCRDQGDSKGTLKLFVSVSPAPVHEALVQPVEQHPIPPVVTTMVNTDPLRFKRRSRSRNGSLSSQGESQPPKDGYEADIDNPDRETSKTVSRTSPSQQGTTISPSISSTQPSQLPRRRPSIVHHRPSSPLVPPEQSNSSQSSGDRRWPSRKEEKYGHALPVVPVLPPPFSPHRPSFSLQDESSTLAASSRYAPVSLGSDVSMATVAAPERGAEQADTHGHSRTQESTPLRSTSRENLKSHPRKPHDEDEQSLDSAPTVSGSSSTHRGTRLQNSSSSSRLRPTSPYTTRLPHSSRPAASTVPTLQDARTSSQQRSGRQPLPSNYVVTWKLEEAVNKKPSSSMATSRMNKSFKSMENLKLNNPVPSNRRNATPQLPMPRPTGNIAYSPSNLSLSGTPKSYDQPRGSSFSRPLPTQSSSPHASASEFGSTYRGGYSSNLMSPSHDPFPRPLSAAGDSATSPVHGYSKVASPVYGSSTLDTGDSLRSPRGVSPQRRFPPQGGIPGPRPRPHNYSDPSDRSSDIQSGPETSNTTPPRTPISPQSPREHPSEQNGIVVDPSSPSSLDDPMIKDNRASDMTLKKEDQVRFSKLINVPIQEDTVITRGQVHPSPLRPKTPPQLPALLAPPPLPPLLETTTPISAYPADDDDDDSDNGDGTWIIRPGANTRSPRPPLTVQIGDTPPSARQPNRFEVSFKDTLTPPSTATAVPATARRDAPPATKQSQRSPEGTFVEDENDNWVRPPPENIYDHLEKFFPKHDLDKPFIETVSGDTSPTTLEPAATAALPPPAPVNDNRTRIRGKKSIRIVVQEHKNRIDRTSKTADTVANNNNNQLRKRNTKLWGIRVEEVTTGQLRSMTSTPDSPSGGPSVLSFILFSWGVTFSYQLFSQLLSSGFEVNLLERVHMDEYISLSMSPLER